MNSYGIKVILQAVNSILLITTLILRFGYGVPQGNIVGPIPFLVFISDVVRSSCDSTFFFVDDTIVFLLDKSPYSLISRTNDMSFSVKTWLVRNCLPLN